jgi:hypothetical protein
LIRRYRAGERVKIIAFALGVSTGALDHQIARLQRAGLLAMRNRRWDRAEDLALLHAIGAGSKPADLVARFGRTAESIRMRVVTLRREQRQAQALAESAWAAPRGEAAPMAADEDQFMLELRAA